MYWSLVLLIASARLITSRCECGYSVGDADNQEALLFTDHLETDFNQASDISKSNQWLAQQFDVSAEDGRGTYGKRFMPSNVVTQPSLDGTGLGLRVGSDIQHGAVPAAEIDTRRLDLRWGSYRAGMKLTAVNGTCAAFFWVSSRRDVTVEYMLTTGAVFQ